MISRRGLITGLVSLVAAPAIVRVASLMPVKVMEPPLGIITNYDIVSGAPAGIPVGGEVLYFQNRIFWIVGPRTVAWSDVQ